MIKKIILLFTLFYNVISLPIMHHNDIKHFNTSNISRIVIIADVHSDYDRFNKILKNAKILDKNDKWIADNGTLLVQLGDQIDRKHIDRHDISNKHHFKITYYTDYLKNVAINHNSNFISLIGNHELMNIDKIRNKTDIQKIIAERPVLLKINNYIFCHGGFTKLHYDFMKSYNKEIDDINKIWKKYVMNYSLSNDEEKLLNFLILDSTNSILYIRKELDTKELLHYLNIEYMFVGHSETESIHLKNKVWYLDQMLKTAFDNKNYNYLEIVNSSIYVKSLDY
jgi:hypothetical protein